MTRSGPPTRYAADCSSVSSNPSTGAHLCFYYVQHQPSPRRREIRSGTLPRYVAASSAAAAMGAFPAAHRGAKAPMCWTCMNLAVSPHWVTRHVRACSPPWRKEPRSLCAHCAGKDTVPAHHVSSARSVGPCLGTWPGTGPHRPLSFNDACACQGERSRVAWKGSCEPAGGNLHCFDVVTSF